MHLPPGGTGEDAGSCEGDPGSSRISKKQAEIKGTEERSYGVTYLLLLEERRDVLVSIGVQGSGGVSPRGGVPERGGASPGGAPLKGRPR